MENTEKRLKPANDFVLLRQCYRPDEDGIVLPDKSRDSTFWCEVVAIGPRCRHLGPDAIGMFCAGHELRTGQYALGDAWYVTRESNIEFLLDAPE